MKKHILSLLVAIGLIGSASAQLATTDTFGTGDNQFSLDFRTIRNAGNAADTTGYGSVGYTYRIGTYSISQNQIDKATASGLQNVVAGAWSGDQPAANMTWYESAAFVNWLNVSKGFQPAYNLTWSGSTWSMALWTIADAGYDANNLYRNSLAKYFLPSENEFYKAAYGKIDGSGYYFYTTACDITPIAVTSGTVAGTAVFTDSSVSPSSPASIFMAGGLSPYGTMGQGGNIHQWEETAFNGSNTNASDNRGFRGGCYLAPADNLLSSSRYSCIYGPNFPDPNLGLRVASVDIGSIPEPSTYALFGIGAIGVLMVIRRKKTA
jgi:formylglycine-generating enzyme required for sulfatase activity